MAEELEIDDKEEEAVHFIIKKGERIIGTCRIRIINNMLKLERMAILPDYRKQGLGSLLVHKMVECAKDNNLSQIYLHAQLRAKEFYLKNGFEIAEEETFMEAGIEHLKMYKKI